MEEVLNGYVTNPKPRPTQPLTPTLTKVIKKIQKETNLEIDQRRNVSLVDGNK
jgi:hypothetical protein